MEISKTSEWVVYELMAINGEWKQPTATAASGQRQIKNILPLAIHGRQNAQFFSGTISINFPTVCMDYELNWFNADGCGIQSNDSNIKTKLKHKHSSMMTIIMNIIWDFVCYYIAHRFKNCYSEYAVSSTTRHRSCRRRRRHRLVCTNTQICYWTLSMAYLYQNHIAIRE